jgi:hypothetical protein
MLSDEYAAPKLTTHKGICVIGSLFWFKVANRRLQENKLHLPVQRKE